VKKRLLFILIPLVLLIGAGLFLEFSDSKNTLLPVALKNKFENSQEATEAAEQKDLFKNYGAAPEFTGVNKWLNSDALKMSDLKGKVVLVDFWTYSCINCVRTLPYITKWYDQYKDSGLVVVGVHTPEFAFEKVTGNVENAIKTNKINYPVAQDNDYKTWSAYKNQFWPANYLIDKDGNIVYTHFGEGNYDITEKAIRTLLGLEGNYEAPKAAEVNQAQTPEIYFGLARLKNLGNEEKPQTTEQIYTFPKKLGDNKFALEGRWQFNQESAIHTSGYGKIKLNFNAAKVFMVAESSKPITVKVHVDGELIKGVVVSGSDLYSLFESLTGGPHTMEIEIPEGGFQAFTFTFG
jgi:thiol-disulfide isomerase/thioredoxin